MSPTTNILRQKHKIHAESCVCIPSKDILHGPGQKKHLRNFFVKFLPTLFLFTMIVRSPGGLEKIILPSTHFQRKNNPYLLFCPTKQFNLSNFWLYLQTKFVRFESLSLSLYRGRLLYLFITWRSGTYSIILSYVNIALVCCLFLTLKLNYSKIWNDFKTIKLFWLLYLYDCALQSTSSWLSLGSFFGQLQSSPQCQQSLPVVTWHFCSVVSGKESES